MPVVHIPEMPKGLGKVDALELQNFWHKFFSDPRYRRNLMKRILQGEAAHMEILLHHMVYGKPKESLSLANEGDGTLILNIGGTVQVEVHADKDGFVRKTTDAEVTVIETNGGELEHAALEGRSK